MKKQTTQTNLPKENISSITSLQKNQFSNYEVSPTIPESNDQLRDKEVSDAIANWKKLNQSSIKVRP
ncbi:hypothetical protein PQ460_19195 [Paenibacillus sp. KACC 21273]|uniref:hypothetical protein n=1 Tax=Paenibacillus sp. KACC 21273 TaxID=3025665 RepID=UPI0023668DEC|nr:hypothetical protein [Paenibacillus sp. KACC 21273]WDF50090.1 hypothetical protein PQ460_19195 [Paenibacillus sp. KACC 21273]